MLNSATVKIQYCTICKTNLEECTINLSNKVSALNKVADEYIKRQHEKRFKEPLLKYHDDDYHDIIKHIPICRSHEKHSIEMIISLTEFEWACENIWINYNLLLQQKRKELQKVDEIIVTKKNSEVKEISITENIDVIDRIEPVKLTKNSWWCNW